jgi:hypothetical protein
MFRKVLVVIVPLVLLSMVFAHLTSARAFRNTFEHDAYLSHGGRFVEVIAEIECTAGERVTVKVTLSQGSQDFEELEADWPSALGHGLAHASCDGEGNTQLIPVRVIAMSRNTFVAGPATASGLAITRHRGQQTDVRQWQPAAGITIN